MEFFNNQNNNNLKFKLNTQGIDYREVEPRLVFSTNENVNIIIFGKINEGVCTFDIPELKVYEKENSGSLKFELVSQDMYFNVWEEKFNIKTKSFVKVDEVYSDESINKPSIEAIFEKVEPSEEEKVIEEDKVKDKEEEIKEEIKEEKIEEKTKTDVLSFDKFIK